MSEKKEIKINKRKLKMNISIMFLALLISFIFLFTITLFGHIEVYRPFSHPGTLIYKGLLADEENLYFGNGNLVKYQNEFFVTHNIFLGYESSNKLTFRLKFFVFYLPLVLFKKFWLWMLLSIFIVLLFHLKSYIKSKYSVKFE